MYSQEGQGGDADAGPRDLRAELFQAEAAHRAKLGGTKLSVAEKEDELETTSKRLLHSDHGNNDEEDPASKRRRILEETREIDADSDGGNNTSSEDERWVTLQR